VKWRLSSEHAAALLVLALHGVALWGLLGNRLAGSPAQTPALMVDLIAPTAVKPIPIPKATPLSVPRVAEPARIRPSLTGDAMPAAPEMPAVATSPIVPKIAVAPAPTPEATQAPVRLSGELAVSCPDRSEPEYPLASRRRNEIGTTLLHVELDDKGSVAATTVLETSGSSRLDDAAVAAVKRWRCNPPQRDGQAVRAYARQAFKFVLQGS
jgi:protein TonB